MTEARFRIRATTLAAVGAIGAVVTALTLGRGIDVGHRTPTVVEVRPQQAEAQIGESVHLSAVLLDDDGREVPNQRFEWWSPHPEIAKVDSSGVVLGVGPGTVSIAAITADRSHSGFAEITVVEPESRAPTSAEVMSSEGATETSSSVAVPPPTDRGDRMDARAQAGGNGAGPNEPPGMTFIVDRPFLAYNENGWTDRRQGGPQLVSDGVARVTYRRGFVGGGAPGESWVRLNYDEGGHETVYVAFEYLLSSNWQGHPSGMNKIWYFSGFGRTFATVKAYGGPEATGFPIQVTNKQTKNSVSGRRGLNINSNRSGPRLRKGQRALIEMVITMNSSETAYDGELHVWIDGVRTHEYTPARGNGIRWWDSNPKAARRITGLKWAPVWGGTRSEVSETMYAELSRVYVSGR